MALGESAQRSTAIARSRPLTWPWERLALGGILLFAAALCLFRLDQNGYGNEYYAATVRSMLTSGANFFFASFDPGGFVSVDKPPLAFWIQAASARLLGFGGLSLILPQALAGVASVALVYALVRRTFGARAGLIAALALAITPISVAMSRENHPDGLLVLTLLLAAWALIRATESGRLRWLLLCAVLVGLGFNEKMLQALVVLPAFSLVYLLGAPVDWRRRLVHLAAASGVLLVVSLSWAVVVDLTPADQRPYVGSSQTNSVLNLIVGYNGLGRVAGGPGGPGQMPPFPPGGGPPAGAPFAPPPGPGQPPPGPPPFAPPGGMGQAPPFPPGAPGFPPPPTAWGQPLGGPGLPPFGGPPGPMDGGAPGPLRLLGRQLVEQWGWLLPLVAFGLLAAIPRTRPRLPLSRRGQALLLWTTWLVVHLVVFSFARGIFHRYYLVMLGPAVAALVGIGVAALVDAYRQPGPRGWLLPLALLTGGVFEARLLADYPDWSGWLVPVVLSVAALAAAGLAALRLAGARARPAWAGAIVATGLLVLAIGPMLWSATPVLARGEGTIPFAGPELLSGIGPPGPRAAAPRTPSRLVQFLEANRAGRKFLVAAPSSMSVAPIILQTGEPAMAMGGFMGGDPILTPERLADLVAGGSVRYVLGSPTDRPASGPPGPGTLGPVTEWVQAHCAPVAAERWRSDDEPLGFPPGGPPPPPPGFGPPGGPPGLPPGFPPPPPGGEATQLYDCAG